MHTTFELLIEKLSKQASIKKIPLSGAFELTSRCSLDCKMCYIHKREDSNSTAKELSTDQWISLASDARDAGMLNLVLTGGEVFLREDFETIYENIARMGFNISIYTNATLIDRRRSKWLGKIPPSTIEITLYGASAETYGKLCGNAAAYEHVINAIDLLITEGIHVELKTTITRDNINDYDAMAEFSYKRGIPFSIVDYLYPAESARNVENAFRLTPKNLVDFQYDVYKTNIKLSENYLNSMSVQKDSACRDKLINEMAESPADSQKFVSAFGCNAGSSGFWITWDGHMLPCGAMREPFFQPLEIGFKNAWQELVDHCNSIPVSSECKKCESIDFCILCPAKLKCETGYYDCPAPYLCELAQLSKERFTKLVVNSI